MNRPAVPNPRSNIVPGSGASNWKVTTDGPPAAFGNDCAVAVPFRFTSTVPADPLGWFVKIAFTPGSYRIRLKILPASAVPFGLLSAAPLNDSSNEKELPYVNCWKTSFTGVSFVKLSGAGSGPPKTSPVTWGERTWGGVGLALKTNTPPSALKLDISATAF